MEVEHFSVSAAPPNQSPGATNIPQEPRDGWLNNDAVVAERTRKSTVATRLRLIRQALKLSQIDPKPETT